MQHEKEEEKNVTKLKKSIERRREGKSKVFDLSSVWINFLPWLKAMDKDFDNINSDVSFEPIKMALKTEAIVWWKFKWKVVLEKC